MGADRWTFILGITESQCETPAQPLAFCYHFTLKKMLSISSPRHFLTKLLLLKCILHKGLAHSFSAPVKKPCYKRKAPSMLL